MKLLIRYGIVFFAGLGMDQLASAAYFLLRQTYAHWLPNPFGDDMPDNIGVRGTIVTAVIFLIFQAIAYAGMRVALNSRGRLWKSD